MTALLGIAGRGGSRRDLIREMMRAISRQGIYADSREELARIEEDPLSVIPLAAVVVQLLAHPRSAARIASGAISAYALTPAAARMILGWGGRNRAAGSTP